MKLNRISRYRITLSNTAGGIASRDVDVQEGEGDTLDQMLAQQAIALIRECNSLEVGDTIRIEEVL